MKRPNNGYVNEEFWHGKRVFLTGHTGFKGVWLSIWLKKMGAKVYGYSLPSETNPSMFEVLEIEQVVDGHTLGDIRELDVLSRAFNECEPDCVIHMAAQAIVSTGYTDPVGTFNTNVMGTVNVLECCRMVQSNIPVLVVSSDKCYLNLDTGRSFVESDPLGGKDPYSASKAGTEIITSAYSQSYFSGDNSPCVGSARAGNVIGGGDWNLDRLIPDMVRAWSEGKTVKIRNPKATRPWQHVLDPVSGYLIACEKISENKSFARAWNFGPDQTDGVPVSKVVEKSTASWGDGAKFEFSKDKNNWVEAKLLNLDCSDAINMLDWNPVFDLDTALQTTVEWYKAYYEQGDKTHLYNLTLAQIDQHNQIAGRL